MHWRRWWLAVWLALAFVVILLPPTLASTSFERMTRFIAGLPPPQGYDQDDWDDWLVASVLLLPVSLLTSRSGAAGVDGPVVSMRTGTVVAAMDPSAMKYEADEASASTCRAPGER